MAKLLAPIAGRSAPRLAETVRANFGTLSRALLAPRERREALGKEFARTFDLIDAAERLTAAARRERIIGSRVDPQDIELQHFLKSSIGAGKRERMIVIFCDNSGQYLLDEEMGWGNEGTVEVDMPSLLRRALMVNASSFLLAHNHPSGNCAPSPEDISATRELAKSAHLLGLSVLDHLIVTSRDCYSLRRGAIL